MTTQKPIVTLDPRDEGERGAAILAPRPSTLGGKVIGLLSNNKPHSEELLRMIAELIGERYQLKGIVEHNKATVFNVKSIKHRGPRVFGV